LFAILDIAAEARTQQGMDGASTDVEGSNAGRSSNPESVLSGFELFNDLSENERLSDTAWPRNKQILAIHGGIKTYFLL
jgi:hypothetical protein